MQLRGGPRRETPEPTQAVDRAGSGSRQPGRTPGDEVSTGPAAADFHRSLRVSRAETAGAVATDTSVQAARSPAASHRPTA
ncbi:MAG: hypothetical protein JWQ15_1118, partial [Marmoricola sp.]|nr:hypothetical protein [Marmoricola sp.]